MSNLLHLGSVCVQGGIEELLLRHVVGDRAVICALLLSGTDVLTANGWWWDRLAHLHGGVHLVLKNSVHLVLWQIRHRLGVFRLNLKPLARKLDLVEQPERGATLLLHDLVDELAIETHFELSKRVLYQVEVVNLGFLVLPTHDSVTVSVSFKVSFLLLAELGQVNLVVASENLSKEVAIREVSLEIANGLQQ